MINIALCLKSSHLLKTQNHEMFNLNKIISLPIFIKHMNLFFAKKKSSHNSPKIGKWKKRDETNINLRGRKKREGGVCHRQYGSQNLRIYKCYEICFYMQKSKISILSPLIIISKLTF